MSHVTLRKYYIEIYRTQKKKQTCLQNIPEVSLRKILTSCKLINIVYNNIILIKLKKRTENTLNTKKWTLLLKKTYFIT